MPNRHSLVSPVVWFAIAALLVAAPAIAAAGDLIAHWPMEGIENGIVRDATGNGYDATAHGKGDSVPEVVDGIAGKALRFHRDLDQYLRVEKRDGLAAPEAFTVMAWIRPAMRKGAHGIIGNKSDKSGDPPWPGWRFRYFWARVIFQFGAADGKEPRAATENWSVHPGFWHHVAAVYGEGKLSLYINCNHVVTEQLERQIMPSGRRFIVGNYVGRKNAYAFDGMIDELKVFDRALSEDEIFRAAIDGMPK